MARKRTVDVCIFCAPDPCTCGVAVAVEKTAPSKPARKKAAPKPTPATPVFQDEPVAVPDPEPTPAPRRAPGARAAMRAHAAKPQPKPVAPVMVAAPQKEQVAPVAEPVDAVMVAALQACAPIMHPSEKTKHADVLWKNTDVAVRAAQWRARRQS